jgi:hypothetical protein
MTKRMKKGKLIGGAKSLNGGGKSDKAHEK